MLRRLAKSKAQSTAEYAVLFALVVGAALAMQVYVKRGIQGRVKNVVDHTGTGGFVGRAQFAFTGEQYEPYYLASEAQTSRSSSQEDVLGRGGESAKSSIESTQQKKEQVTGWDETDIAATQEEADSEHDFESSGARPETPTVATSH
ncbi:MAG: hypothetical protein KBA46_01180 [Candidatus Omnitrophica bacterium]|nr:hypothetical protein [Candidatus Omnitrophota bacterium]